MTDEFLLLRPWWLLALAPVLAAALWVRHRRLAGEWAAIIDPALLPALRRLGTLSHGRHHAAMLLPFVAAAIIVLALSGPARLLPGAVAYRALDPLILVLDLSPSVTGGPALDDLQTAAATVMAQTRGRPVGVMVYGADAYLASAPTSDAASLQSLIAVLDNQTMPVSGSRPDIALSMAADLFATDGVGIGGADLIVISDGGGAGPRALEESARLKRAGARVWTLSLDQSAPDGPAPDPAALAALAKAGGGGTAPARDTPELLARIDDARTAQLVRSDAAAQSVHDFGPWVLFLALPFAALLFRRRR